MVHPDYDQQARGQQIGQNLRSLRDKKGIGLKKLAKKAGVSFIPLRNLEHGIVSSPNMEVLEKVADALEVSLEDLLGKENI